MERRIDRQGSTVRRWLGVMLLGGVVLSILSLATSVDARRQKRVENATEEPQEKNSKDEKPTPYTSAILMDAETGKVLYEKDAHTPLPPASMIKMMTTLIVLERVREGSLKLDDMVTVSRWAAQMGGSQVYLKEGETFSVEDLLKAVMIHSANDATTALAEHIAGSADAFVDLMNDKAAELGLKESRYYSVHGLPPAEGQEIDVMSAYDLAVLGRELMKFPEAAKWAATVNEPFRGGQFTMTNPNHLLRQFAGADGIKTGFHNKAGFCVTGSAKRGDLRLIVVVLGTTPKQVCFKSAAQILNQGFANYRMLVPVKAGSALNADAPVNGGAVETVPLVASSDIRVLVKKGEEKKVQVEVNVANDVAAPIKAGQVMGEVVVKVDGAEVSKTSAAAAQDVALGSLWQRWSPF